MEKEPKTKKEHKNKEPNENPKNVLDCKIACVARKSRFIPSLKRARVRSTNIYSLELNEYQDKSYVKRITCPKCMSKMELTVRSEKAGLLYYKLILLGGFLLFLVINSLLLQDKEASTFQNNIIEANAVILASLVVLTALVLINNYVKTRSKRSIRLKIKAEYKSMSHKLHKSKRTKFKKQKNVIPNL